jgi:aspartate/methionine/tyrosine aminotransferase
VAKEQPVPDFRPFEYMTWSKSAPPGARYVMRVSGLPPPEWLRSLPTPPWEVWSGPSKALLEQFAAQVTAMLGVPDRALAPAGGASAAIFLALAACAARGRPVIVEQPAYRAMERVVQFLGAAPVRLERHHEGGWRLDPERLDALLAETGAPAVAITDPHNPTGVSTDDATRAAIGRVVERRGAVLVVDETFAQFRGPERPPAWASLSERILSLGSLTKGWGLASLRAGWVIGAPALVARCTQLFDLLDVNPPSATLALALAALDHAEALDQRAQAASERVREVFAGARWPAGSMVLPDDGIIGFLRLPDGWTSERAAAELRALDGVQTVPGHFFGCDGYLRVGFAPELTDGAEGCRLIAARLKEKTS